MLERFRIGERCHQFAGGIKALAALAFTVGLAFADYYDAVPLAPALTQLFGADAATKLTLVLPIVFGTLRFVSTNQVKWHHHDDDCPPKGAF
jgi:hypothetical protein